MVVAWLMVGTGKTFALDAVGAWAIESLVYFFIGALAIALLGVGVIRWPVSRPGGKVPDKALMPYPAYGPCSPGKR